MGPLAISRSLSHWTLKDLGQRCSTVGKISKLRSSSKGVIWNNESEEVCGLIWAYTLPRALSCGYRHLWVPHEPKHLKGSNMT